MRTRSTPRTVDRCPARRRARTEHAPLFGVAASLAAIMFVAAAAQPAAAKPPVNTHGLTIVRAAASVPDDLREAYAAASMVAMGAPDDFGYPAIDGAVVDLPTVSAAATALQASPPSVVKAKLNGYAKGIGKKADDPDPATAPDLGNSLDHVKLTHPAQGRSATKLRSIKDQVFDLGQLPAFARAAVTESGIDASGHVILTVGELTDALAGAIVARFGTEDVRIVIDPSMTSSTASRASDSSPYYGGAVIIMPSGGLCTSGFPWRNGTTQMMVTAGHCGPTGGIYKAPSKAGMGYVTANSQENWNTGVGTVFLSGQRIYRGDLSLIVMSLGDVSPRIYRGGVGSNTYAIVGGMSPGPPANGDKFCTGGAQSGEICYWQVDQVAVDHKYSDGTYLRNGTRGKVNRLSGWTIIQGDSGGPVYTVRSDGKIAAKGIISGQGSSILNNFVYFTDIWEAYYGFPGRLAVG